MSERLQKYLARCGIASRRHAEQWILDGKVEVDGVVVTTLGTKVDPERQEIWVEGERISPPRLEYYALYKPTGVVCTTSDPSGRPRVVDLVPSRHGTRLFPIGRLDEDSEGLILLTNDGDLAQRVAHPRFEVEKVYRVVVRGSPAPGALERLRKGVWLSEGRTHPARVLVERKTHQLTTLRISLREGRNRHLRRVLAKVELPVKRLLRIAVGPVRLGRLKRGEFRPLKPAEVEALREGRTSRPAPSRGAGGRTGRSGSSRKARSKKATARSAARPTRAKKASRKAPTSRGRSTARR